MGKKEGGIDGYRDAPNYANPPPFEFPLYDSGIDYRDALMHCYFKRIDVESFVPTIRYLSYQQLVARWAAFIPEADAIAFIKAKCAVGELVGLHPITGAVSGSGIGLDEREFPALVEGVFAQNQYEEIEARQFPNRSSQPTVSNIAAENKTYVWLVGLMRSGPPKMAKAKYRAQAIEQFHVSIKGFIRAWSKSVADTGNTSWSQKGRKLKPRN